MYLIPKPQKLTKSEGHFILSYDSYLVLDKAFSALVQNQALLFVEKLEARLGYPLLLTKYQAKAGDLVFIKQETENPEGYTIDSTGDTIVVKAGEKGVWLAMQTLLQMVEQCGAALPRVQIEDYPELANRGHYLDVTRGRIPKMSWLKRWVDRLASYKINQLQLYIEHTYLFRDLPELWRDDTPYTAKDIMELDEYCHLRGIELVPSLSSFGHLYKLLSSYGHHHLCERENSLANPFSVLDRMRHHTIDVSNPESFELIKSMLDEFMSLFRSKQFNICADETFDLGSDKNKAKAEEVGKNRLYIDFVKKLTEYIVSTGRRPMFWGDVIVGFPELIKELPEETICLTWGYAWNQREYETEKMAEAGATQYCCPGCCGWNEIINLNWNSYHNIKLMAQYAGKHKAIGLLNTDWGDFLHVNHLDFSVTGMIYGAAFSWNNEIPEYEDINRQISRVEFGDASESLLAEVEKVRQQTAFSWQSFNHFYEREIGVGNDKAFQNRYLAENRNLLDDIDQKTAEIDQIRTNLYQLLKHMPTAKREEVRAYLVSLDGLDIINQIGNYAVLQKEGKAVRGGKELAYRLDQWFHHYKEVYRGISRESELYKMQEMMNFYGDLLRK